VSEVRTPLTMIIVTGGLPPGSAPPSGRAVDPAGRSLTWTRGPDESEDAFHARAEAEAEAAGCETLVIGGLPIRPRGE
jgi:hypothetical protein